MGVHEGKMGRRLGVGKWAIRKHIANKGAKKCPKRLLSDMASSAILVRQNIGNMLMRD